MLKRCKVCGKDYFDKSSFIGESPVCIKCFNEFKVCEEVILVNNVKIKVLYYYEDFFRNLIYLFKGCGDYEFKDAFLTYFVKELNLKYHDYYIVPAPSNLEDDEKRGYNHVEEIFSCLKMPQMKLLKKNKYFKQSDRNKEEREGVKNDISLATNEPLINKKILLVDDIVTTGSTITACYELIETLHPKKIKVLCLAKKINSKNED